MKFGTSANLLLNKEYKQLSEVANIRKGESITKKSANPGSVPVIAGGRVSPYNHNESNYDGNVITVSASGDAGFVRYHKTPIWASDCSVIWSKCEAKIKTKYIFYCMKSRQEEIYQLKHGTTLLHIYPKDLQNFLVPIVNWNEQCRILNVLDKTVEIEQNQHQVIENLRHLPLALFYEMFGNPVKNENEWEMIEIGDITEKIQKSHPRELFDNTFPYIDIASVDGKIGKIKEIRSFSVNQAPSRARQVVIYNDVLVSMVRPYLKGHTIIDSLYDTMICSTGFSVLRCSKIVHPIYLYVYVRLNEFKDAMMSKSRGASYPSVSEKDVRTHKVLLPPINFQLEFVEKMKRISKVEHKQSKFLIQIGQIYSDLGRRL